MSETPGMEQRLSLITLGVSDIARARRFYVEGLGWRPSAVSNDDVVFIQLNGMALSLYSRKALAEDAGVSPKGDGFMGFALAYNVREKHDVESILNLAAQAGGTIIKPAQETFWGGYSGYFKDPDGFLWEVAHNPGFQLTKEGHCILP